MSTPLRVEYDAICDQLETVKQSADKEKMDPALIVFLPDGKRFRVRKFGYKEPCFFWFNGEEEEGSEAPGLFVVRHESAQFLFELRRPERERSRRRPGFIERDDRQVVVKN